MTGGGHTIPRNFSGQSSWRTGEGGGSWSHTSATHPRQRTLGCALTPCLGGEATRGAFGGCVLHCSFDRNLEKCSHRAPSVRERSAVRKACAVSSVCKPSYYGLCTAHNSGRPYRRVAPGDHRHRHSLRAPLPSLAPQATPLHNARGQRRHTRKAAPRPSYRTRARTGISPPPPQMAPCWCSAERPACSTACAGKAPPCREQPGAYTTHVHPKRPFQVRLRGSKPLPHADGKRPTDPPSLTGAAASQCVTPRGVRQFGGL